MQAISAFTHLFIMKRIKNLKKILIICVSLVLALGLIAVATLFGVNAYVKSASDGRILTYEEALELDGIDCILVLGCAVRAGGVPSDMLADRIRCGIELYKGGAAPKLLMSGDHGRVEYNEVAVMKQTAIDAGIPSSDVFMDHAGFSTYESLYRARDVFEVRRVIIVTQEYHLYRAIYIAEQLGLEAYGVDAAYREYGGQAIYDSREVLARFKDFLTGIFKPEPTYLGEVIPISGDGDLTND